MLWGGKRMDRLAQLKNRIPLLNEQDADGEKTEKILNSGVKS